jgi:hypothetical protein
MIHLNNTTHGTHNETRNTQISSLHTKKCEFHLLDFLHANLFIKSNTDLSISVFLVTFKTCFTCTTQA